MRKIRLLVQGWRGINHSYAMVNQFQLLELLQRPEIELFHQDLPYFNVSWNIRDNASGLPQDDMRRLAAIPPPDGGPMDVIYRICFPYRAHAGDAAKLFCFATCEFGHVDDSYFFTPTDGPRVAPNMRFVAPSHWSKRGIAASGLENVDVVPHGVSPALFQPLSAEARGAARRHLGLPPERFVFLNVGAMTDNKGIDLLLLAFAEVHRSHPQAMLLLKDQRKLYGIKAQDVVAQTLKTGPGRMAAAVRAIGVIGGNLELADLRALYGACDAYVSPYRAEGFNLPPLEAAACGTPIIVTAGGATDDYARDNFALRVPSKPSRWEGRDVLQPDGDALTEAMLSLIERRAPALDAAEGARWIRDNFSWKNAVDRLVTLF